MNHTTKILLRRFEHAVRQLALDECAVPADPNRVADTAQRLINARRDFEAELERLEQCERKNDRS